VDLTPADVTPVAQLAFEIAVETFGFRDVALDGADFAARRADVFEVAAELFEQPIKLAQIFFDATDIRMTAVNLMRDFFRETVDFRRLFLHVANTYTHFHPHWFKRASPGRFLLLPAGDNVEDFAFLCCLIVKVNC
jgi:hypothetical protein